MTRPRLRLILFSLLPAAVLLGGAELGLRLAGFRYQRSLGYMQFAFPNSTELHQVYQPDPALLWRMRPGFDFGHGFPKLNARGFRGPDFFAAREPAAFRVACLGDSVTFGRPEADYPSLLQRALEDKFPGRAFLVGNFGVPGYSSFQGLQLLTHEVLEAKPDAVVVLFGWNDHWRVQGFSDHEQKMEGNPALIEWRDALSRLRVYQALNKLTAVWRANTRREAKLRVPEERYRANLLAMIRAGRKRGATVILCTTPAGFCRAPLPDFFTALGFARSATEIEPLHRRYNDIARQVARQENAPLLDLEKSFEWEGVTNFFDHPREDVIHPNARGLELIARSLAELLATRSP